MAEKSFIVFTLVFVLALSHGVDSCSCGTRPLQQEFCDAHFVLQAVIDSDALRHDGTPWEYEPDNWDSVKHRLREVRVLRAIEKYNLALDKDFIYTAAHGSLCGAYLRNQTEYIIFGDLYNGYLHTSSCTRTKPWSWVSRRYQDDYINKLPQYCADCKIAPCGGWRHRHPACDDENLPQGDRDTCIMRDTHCAFLAYCRRSEETGKCNWVDVNDGEEVNCAGADIPVLHLPETLPDQPEIMDIQPVDLDKNATDSSLITNSTGSNTEAPDSDKNVDIDDDW